jgi:MscS family membrane protein
MQLSLSLTRETAATQMRSVLDGVNNLLVQNSLVELDSIRVRFLRFGVSSSIWKSSLTSWQTNWNAFLEIQQELLLEIMDVVQGPISKLHLIAIASSKPGRNRDVIRRLLKTVS